MTAGALAAGVQANQTDSVASLEYTFSPASPVAPIVVAGTDTGSAAGSTWALTMLSLAGAASAGAAKASATTSAVAAATRGPKMRAFKAFPSQRRSSWGVSRTFPRRRRRPRAGLGELRTDVHPPSGL